MSILSNTTAQGTRAAQPLATGVPTGTLYGVTDEGNIIERSNGTTWVAYSPTGGGGGVVSPTTANGILSTGTGLVIPQSLEVGGGFSYEVGSGARLEITGDAAQDLGYIELGTMWGLGSSVNLSTIGTLDWLHLAATITNPTQTSTTVHSKVSGGWMRNSFEWMITGTTTIFSSAAPVGTTSNAGDDCAAAVLSGSTNGVGQFNSTGSLLGYRIRVPACPTKRILYVYLGSFKTDVKVTASLPTSSTPAKVLNLNYFGGNNPGRSELIKVAYTGTTGAELVLTVVAQTTGLVGGSNPNVSFFFGWLGTA